MYSYKAVISACALRLDINALPQGDMTEIGERGVTLSGGQKQRINIARAIYADRGIVLMDDPLSAVDAHVGRHIFEQAICGMLSKKCRILATHQLHVLGSCDRVVYMEHGVIEAFDTYENLLKSNNHIGKYLSERQLAVTSDVDEALNAGGQNEAVGAEHSSQIKTSGKSDSLMRDEGKDLKSVSWRIYAAYFRASGSIFNALWILILLILFRSSNLMVNLWLAYWVSDDFPLTRKQYVRTQLLLSTATHMTDASKNFHRSESMLV